MLCSCQGHDDDVVISNLIGQFCIIDRLNDEFLLT